MRILICLLLAVFLTLAAPPGSSAWEPSCRPCPEEPPARDPVWLDVIYSSYDPDEVRVTRIITREPGVSLRAAPSAGAEKIEGIHADTVLEVIGHVPGWYHVRYRGQTGFVNDSSEFVWIIACVTPEPVTPTPAPVITPTPRPATPTPDRSPSAMEIPALGDRVCRAGEMSMTVFWAQTQLKATGLWYQDDGCLITGVLDETARSAVSEFMAMRGQQDHGGDIDQQVVAELAEYLGGRAVAVYTGGFYGLMDVLMDGGPAGSMTPVGPEDESGTAASAARVRWVQTCLRHLGYYAGRVGGTYDEETRTAVRLFSQDSGFPEQDRVTLGLARAMLEAYYYSRGDLEQLAETAR